ncbi:GNAT family N-acetyltransferase [Geodermatophilus sp. URMC 60]
MTTSTAPAEHLTDGWEPGTPDSDSMCRRYVHHWAAECAAFAAAAGGTVVVTDSYVVTDYGRASGYFNGAVLLAPPRDWDQLLAELDPLLAQGSGEVLLWSLWPTPDLRLRGWTLEGHPPMLLRPPASLAPVPAPVPAPVEVRSPADLARWEGVAVAGYPLDLDGGALTGPELLTDPRITFLLSEEEGEPVSASAHFVTSGLGSLAFAATLPTARGRGHWTRHALARLRLRPDLWHSGVFSDFSRPLAERLGFVPILRFTLWQRSRPAPPH